jgi:hypothetical protein
MTVHVEAKWVFTMVRNAQNVPDRLEQTPIVEPVDPFEPSVDAQRPANGGRSGRLLV